MKYFRNKSGSQIIGIDSDGSITEFVQVGASDKHAVLEEKSATLTKGKKVRVCKACNRPGHRSDNCTVGSMAPLTEAEECTEEQIQQIKDMRADGIKSPKIAKELKLTMKQVNEYW